MPRLFHEVLATIRRHRLLSRGARVVVAVSGGADSMALLDLLHRGAEVEGWRLTVAHFNHRLRGRASLADARFVARHAGRLGLACVTEAGDVRACARARKLSLEMAGRVLRHEFLARVARRHRAHAVALAHHADDQVETFFLRLFRGAGSDGLSGMAMSSPSPADPRVRLVRPLLGVTRADLRAYVAERGLSFREDASNRRLDARRNVLRLRLLPAIRRGLAPALDAILPKLMRLLGDEGDFAERTARAWLARPRASGFAQLHAAVQRRVLLRQLQKRDVAPSFDLVEGLREQAGRRITGPTGQSLWRDARGRLHSGGADGSEFSDKQRAMKLAGSRGRVQFAGLAMSWRIARAIKKGSRRLTRRAGEECFDADRLGRKVVLRHWRPGDRFQPIGLVGTAKLQDLFTNARVARTERHRRVLLANQAGEIVWVEGLRIGEAGRLTERTRRVLVWRWLRQKADGRAVASPKRAW